MKHMIKNVTLSFNDLFTPKAFQDNPPKYSGTVLLPKDGGQIVALNKVIVEVAEEVWEDKAKATLKKCKGDAKRYPVKDGDDAVNREGDPYVGYGGMWQIKASCAEDRPPQVRDRDRSFLVRSDGRPYSGCKVNAMVDVWAQPLTHKFGPAMNIKLLAVQFWEDGDRIGGGSQVTDDDFEDGSLIETDDDDSGEENW